MRKLILGILLVVSQCLWAQTNLTTDLIEHTDRIYPGGQIALVRSSRPGFGWVLDSRQKVQRAYRIVLKTADGLPVWDSGKVRSHSTNSVKCGIVLSPDMKYVWNVTVWTGAGRSTSEDKQFQTAAVLDETFSFYPLDQKEQIVSPVKLLDDRGNDSAGRCIYFADFGRDAFAKLSVTISSSGPGKAVVRYGEALDADSRIQRRPPGSVRFSSCTIELKEGVHSYGIRFPDDIRHKKVFGTQTLADEPPVMMPDYVGEVYPFRYCEIETDEVPVSICRTVVNHPFDDSAASFTSSDSTLNAVWELCRYSIMATSFCGIYVDGDRERIPYEADALINQLGHYSTDREFSMARRSLDYLIFHPTWPTEWNLQIPILAWRDFLYTGDKSLLERRYDDIVAKAMIPLRDSRGLISTTLNDTRSVQEAAHFHKPEKFKDIVDWPRGNGSKSYGEDDGYVLKDYNTVVNAYHYQALVMLSKIAGHLDKEDDAARFSALAGQTANSIVDIFYDSSDGAFRDGEGTDHKALHATLFPLAFGLVPQEGMDRTLKFIHEKGMVCSVYAAQMFLEGLYDAGDDEYALSLMTATSGRCWSNMIKEGSTVTMEAWGQSYKPNQDWNHAWGSAPANIIPRKVLGVEPLAPGCDEIVIHPRPGGLQYAEGVVPTIKGPVHVRLDRKPDGRYDVKATVPGGVKALIIQPAH